MKRFASVLVVSILLFSGAAYAADAPAAAQKEGRLVVYSSTDSASAEPLLADFKSQYPGIQVEYNDLNTTEIYNRFVAEAAAGAGTADFLWSSSMDLQLQLVHNGSAQSYNSPETQHLPKWAVWQNQAFGTTFEPVSIAYNKRLLPADAGTSVRRRCVPSPRTKQRNWRPRFRNRSPARWTWERRRVLLADVTRTGSGGSLLRRSRRRRRHHRGRS